MEAEGSIEDIKAEEIFGLPIPWNFFSGKRI
jgi:hypothetical protein